MHLNLPESSIHPLFSVLYMDEKGGDWGGWKEKKNDSTNQYFLFFSVMTQMRRNDGELWWNESEGGLGHEDLEEKTMLAFTVELHNRERIRRTIEMYKHGQEREREESGITDTISLSPLFSLCVVNAAVRSPSSFPHTWIWFSLLLLSLFN